MHPNRARDLLRLAKWENGMCLCVGAERPDVPPMSDSELRALSGIMGAREGSCTINRLLHEVADGTIILTGTRPPVDAA